MLHLQRFVVAADFGANVHREALNHECRSAGYDAGHTGREIFA
jgi:hypothetical protein